MVCYFSALPTDFISALLALDREARQVWIVMFFLKTNLIFDLCEDPHLEHLWDTKTKRLLYVLTKKISKKGFSGQFRATIVMLHPKRDEMRACWCLTGGRVRPSCSLQTLHYCTLSLLQPAPPGSTATIATLLINNSTFLSSLYLVLLLRLACLAVSSPCKSYVVTLYQSMITASYAWLCTGTSLWLAWASQVATQVLMKIVWCQQDGLSFIVQELLQSLSIRVRIQGIKKYVGIKEM